MTNKEEIKISKKTVSEETKDVIIDLGELYGFNIENLVPDITSVSYSNLAYINVSHRDVHIDFLEMPGIKHDDKILMNGTRIYMSHASAKALADRLHETLEQVHSEGKMEKYIGMKKPDKK